MSQRSCQHEDAMYGTASWRRADPLPRHKAAIQSFPVISPYLRWPKLAICLAANDKLLCSLLNRLQALLIAFSVWFGDSLLITLPTSIARSLKWVLKNHYAYRRVSILKVTRFPTRQVVADCSGTSNCFNFVTLSRGLFFWGVLEIQLYRRAVEGAGPTSQGTRTIQSTSLATHYKRPTQNITDYF
jgi:hypothetical protein